MFLVNMVCEMKHNFKSSLKLYLIVAFGKLFAICEGIRNKTKLTKICMVLLYFSVSFSENRKEKDPNLFIYLEGA